MSTLTKAQVVSALGYTPPEQDTVYTHPSTHPASMITGLESVVSGYGYSNMLTGYSSAKTVTVNTSFTPKFAIAINLASIYYAAIAFATGYGIAWSSSTFGPLSGSVCKFTFNTSSITITMNNSNVYYAIFG